MSDNHGIYSLYHLRLGLLYTSAVTHFLVHSSKSSPQQQQTVTPLKKLLFLNIGKRNVN